MFALRFFRRYTTEALRKNLATALMFPHLDYCSIVFLDVSQELKSRLQRLQNSGVRYVLGLGRSDHISPHRAALGWLRIESRRHYFMILIMKIMRMHNPDYLESLFSSKSLTLSKTGWTRKYSLPRPSRLDKTLDFHMGLRRFR